ncbi:MAG: ribonuclease H, partial [Muribaculaceae bacterium]|nr:ribonuclease H [Muribaculaceae bacterium]
SNPDIDQTAWAVDASCQGNPGIMEYRGVELATGRELFKVGPFQDGTNNIGEFLAIVHALAEMTRRNEWHNIYSDSKTALAWVRNRQVKTQLKQTDRNAKLFELLGRGIVWIRSHSWPVKIMKWQTELWGEIPADFGRK